MLIKKKEDFVFLISEDEDSLDIVFTFTETKVTCGATQHTFTKQEQVTYVAHQH